MLASHLACIKFSLRAKSQDHDLGLSMESPILKSEFWVIYPTPRLGTGDWTQRLGMHAAQVLGGRLHRDSRLTSLLQPAPPSVHVCLSTGWQVPGCRQLCLWLLEGKQGPLSLNIVITTKEKVTGGALHTHTGLLLSPANLYQMKM